MRYLKSLIIAAFAFATAAGTLLAADDPLEIHGGGRIGWAMNSKLGSNPGGLSGGDNSMGSMPNYGETRYLSISFAKKVTADGGAWAKTNVAIDKWTGDADGDLQDQLWRLRDFHIDFGGLDFLPAGTTFWAGLRGYGTGWNGQQDHGFINFSGIGIGLQNIGGVVSIAYMQQDSGSEDAVFGLGERTMHHIIGSVSVPMIDVYGAFGYSKKGKAAGEENLTNAYVGGIFHAPVYGINVGGIFSTNGYAAEVYKGNSDTHMKGDRLSGIGASDTQKYTGIALAAWTVADLAPGLYMAPAIRYDYLKCGEYTSDGENTLNKLGASLRISKSITKNIAFCPTVGYYRQWDKEKVVDVKTLQVYQITAAVEIGLDTGYWAGQKVQLYGTYTGCDKDHKGTSTTPGRLGAGYEGKTAKFDIGCLVTFGF
jgi:maltoporin